MKAFIYTYPGDYELAYLAYQSLIEKAGVDEAVLCYDKDHPAPNPQYPSIATAFPRNGNLNGVKFMKGALEFYLKEANGHEDILKVDADTLVYDLKWLDRPEVLVGLCAIPHRTFYGMAYRIKTKAIPLIQQILEEAEFPYNYAEDLMISELCAELGVYTYDYSCPGVYAGWNWKTKYTAFDYREAYSSVITVYPPEGFQPENARKLQQTKMRQLLEAK